jgi:Holliday junction resolvase
MSAKEKGTRFERQLKKMLEERGFFVVRASGSGSDGVSPDLVALSSTRHLAVECKAWNGDAVYIEKAKFGIMQEWEKRTAIPVFVAWKSPRRDWRFFPLVALKETGRAFGINKADLETGMELNDVVGGSRRNVEPTGKHVP